MKLGKMKLRKGSGSYKLLKYLAFGSGILILGSISPLGGSQLTSSLLSNYFRRKSFEKHRFLTDLKKLQKRELIDYREFDDSRIKIVLTAKGKEKTLIYKLDDIKLDMPRRWDSKWRLIIFDIPHFCKKARDIFRKKLLDLKFYPIQKSVFITPYPCEDEIDFIASVFDIRKYILILYVSGFEGDEKLKYHFNIL